VSSQIAIGNVIEFQQHEPTMLAVINRAPHGPELFMADPFRFLSEHGYAVSPALQAQMENAAPALPKTPKQLYDGIAAGRASLVGDSTVHITWHIRSLGVKL
jgi:hypothetical protein